MKIYIVQNSDGINLGAFKTKKKAKSFALNVGQKNWKEDWTVQTIKLNKIYKIYNKSSRNK
jgi:hypothetical protein